MDWKKRRWSKCRKWKSLLLCIHVVKTLNLEIWRCHYWETASNNCTKLLLVHEAPLSFLIQPIRSLFSGVVVAVAVVLAFKLKSSLITIQSPACWSNVLMPTSFQGLSPLGTRWPRRSVCLFRFEATTWPPWRHIKTKCTLYRRHDVAELPRLPQVRVRLWMPENNCSAGARFSRVRKAIRKNPTRLFCEASLFICCKWN